ncbi:50S ribosomal protein L29 [Candidatus Foliamicus sp.]
MKTAELREMDAAGLKQRLLELRREQLQMRLSQATGQEARVHRHRELRRDIARVKTIMREATAS